MAFYNLENKVRYEELAPSLQAKITANEKVVDDKITNLTNRVDSNKADADAKIANLTNNVNTKTTSLSNSINDLNTRTTKLESTSSVKVTAGDITNNQYIPIPEGFTRAQCKYAVWLTYSGEVVDGGEYWYSSVNQDTGLVKASHTGIGNMPAQYLCIATKN